MDRLDSHLAFVKEQLEAQENLARKYESSPYRAGKHLTTASKLRELLNFLEGIKNDKSNSNISQNSINQKKNGIRIGLTLADIQGIPDELLKELSISDSDRFEMNVEDIISSNGGILSLDRLIIEIFRRTGEISKKSTLIPRLYRMAQKKIIFQVPGRRGVYSTSELTDEETQNIFGQREPSQDEE